MAEVEAKLVEAREETKLAHLRQAATLAPAQPKLEILASAFNVDAVALRAADAFIVERLQAAATELHESMLEVQRKHEEASAAQGVTGAGSVQSDVAPPVDGTPAGDTGDAMDFDDVKFDAVFAEAGFGDAIKGEKRNALMTALTGAFSKRTRRG